MAEVAMIGDRETHGTPDLYEITAEMAPHDREALRLEIQRVAKQHGAEVKEFQIVRPAEGSAAPPDAVEETAAF
jgi:hypothetical protein